MAINLNLNAEPQKGLGHSGNGYVHDLDRQRLRILRCTAQAMASSPGGLRFKAGTQPWLDGIATGGIRFLQVGRPQHKAALQGACI